MLLCSPKTEPRDPERLLVVVSIRAGSWPSWMGRSPLFPQISDHPLSWVPSPGTFILRKGAQCHMGSSLPPVQVPRSPDGRGPCLSFQVGCLSAQSVEWGSL